MAVPYLYQNCVENGDGKQTRHLIKNVAEILVRDGCDLNYSLSSEGKEKLINSRDT